MLKIQAVKLESKSVLNLSIGPMGIREINSDIFVCGICKFRVWNREYSSRESGIPLTIEIDPESKFYR